MKLTRIIIIIAVALSALSPGATVAFAYRAAPLASTRAAHHSHRNGIRCYWIDNHRFCLNV